MKEKTLIGLSRQPLHLPKGHEKDWQCQSCLRWFVVPSLARDCEAKHE